MRPHGVFLAPLQSTERDKLLLHLNVESVSVYEAFQIKLFVQFDEFRCLTPRLFGESTREVLHNKVNQIAIYQI